MVKTLVEHTIKRSEFLSFGVGYDYDITYTDPDRERGFGRMTLEHCGERSLHNPFRQSKRFENELRDQGITEEDYSMKIWVFKPNGADRDGESKPYGYMRQGMGTRLLEHMLIDCYNLNVSFLHITSPHDEMIQFLEKKQFTKAPQSSFHYYLLL